MLNQPHILFAFRFGCKIACNQQLRRHVYAHCGFGGTALVRCFVFDYVFFQNIDVFLELLRRFLVKF